jgi:hypothetical protein
MGWIRTVAREIFGLFVDDVGFAITIVVWLVLCGLLLPPAGIPPAVKAVILFAGLAAILLESAVRRARS